jgi:membrane-associated phospholipid phosphatase
MLNSPQILQKALPLKIEKLEDIGDILQYAVPWAALLVVALQGDKEGAWDWLYAGSLTTIFTHLLKFMFNFTPLGRRPNGSGYAFPSGHTSSAFMGAAFVHFQFGIYWAIVPYLLAALTGYSRVRAKEHWWRDVITGAALAIVIGYLVIVVW